MKLHLVLTAAIACALAACSGTAGLASPTTTGFGTDPAPSHGAEPARGSEPAGGGAEPGVSGLDPPPGGRGGNSIPQLCSQVCARLGSACGGGNADGTCAGDCTADVTASGTCQGVYIAFLDCLITATLTCDGTNLLLPPECYDEILAVDQCESSTSPPPTAGGTPSAGL